MSELDASGDAPDFMPPRVPRGRRSGVVLPGGPESDSDRVLLESVKAAPRRSSIIKDPSMHKLGGGRKKTVSFSSMPSEKKVSSAADCLAFMQGGCELKKIRPSSRVYCRFYTLDQDLSCLHWEPSKKDGERARLDVSTIREVRTGKSTETFLHNGPQCEQLAEEASFSIIHGDDYQSLDLVALSADVANIWVTGLRYLLAHPSLLGGGGGVGGGGGLSEGGGLTMEGSVGSRMRSDWLTTEFSKVDEDGYGIVTENVAVSTICKLCPGIKEGKVRLRFKEVQRSKEKLTSHVTVEEFREAYCVLCTRPDVYFLLVQLSKDHECLDAQDLRLFLETEQGLPLATADGCLELLRRFEPSAAGRERGMLGLDGFTRYLQSNECSLMDPEHQGVCQDMNQPLSHYYISTSYRSYLLDDQVHGRADLGGLVRALQAGCRCLELGVTDGPEGEPLLGVDCGPDVSRHNHHHHHHNASHGPVTFKSALETINKLAFLTSQCPLLVYLCQRCSPTQQRTMAKHLKEVLGSRLYTFSLGGRAPTLPSPDQLKGRILIVGKKLPPDQGGSEGEVSEEDEEIGGGGPLAGRRMTIPGEEELGVVLVVPPPPQPRRLRLHRELSDLVAIARTASRSFYAQRASCRPGPPPSPPTTPTSPGTPNPPELPYWTLCSLGEGEAGRLSSENPEDLVAFTKRTLTRVRPSSVRLDSSNPNPQGYWKGGVQLVALNQQTPGAMLDLHRGRFMQNGGCGYVLRPTVMRDEVSYFSAHTQGCVPGVPPQMLRIKVISAHNLPKPQGSGAKGEVIDPYVVLELHGVPADCAEQRTRTAAQNQDDPLFDETFEFQVNMPELALLRFVVLDDDYIGDDFIGQYSVAFECLQPGYRNVPLLGLAGDPLPHAGLLVHVAVTNRRGGGKAQRRGLSVRRVRRGRDYVSLRNTSIKAVDDAFKQASGPIREAADLREDAQSTTASFKEQCGLPPVATLKQCIQSLAPRLQSPEGTVGASLVLKDGYPCLQPQAGLSETTRKLLSAYDTMMAAQKQLIENADGVQEKIAQVQREGMDFHEELSRLGEKEGLKGRKLNKAVESFTWNITVLKGQTDLLRGAKMDSLDALRQLALACEACGLTASSSSSSSSSSSTLTNTELHSSSSSSSSASHTVRRGSTHGNGRI